MLFRSPTRQGVNIEMCGPKAKISIEKCETGISKRENEKSQGQKRKMERVWEMRCWGADRCGALCSNSGTIPPAFPGPGRIRSPGRRFPAAKLACNQHFTPVYRSRQPSGLPSGLPASSSGLPPVPVPSCLPSGVLLLLTVPAASVPAAFRALYGPVTRDAAQHFPIASGRRRLPSFHALHGPGVLPSFPGSFPGSFPLPFLPSFLPDI